MTSFQKQVEEKYGIDRNEQIAKRLKQMPESYRAKYKKAVTRKSMRAAINSQCLECCGYQRTEVSVCTDLGCPLYLYRPYQKAKISADILADAQADVVLDAI